MPSLTIAAAARHCGVARRTLQRAIQAGRLTLTPDHQLTLEALAQAGYVAATPPQRRSTETPHVTPQGLSQLADRLARLDEHLIMLIHQLETLVPLLMAPHVTPQAMPHVTPQADVAGVPHPSPQVLGLYDPHGAAARIQALRHDGLSYDHIAATLQAEGIPTRYGHPWQGSSVRYVLERYGQ